MRDLRRAEATSVGDTCFHAKYSVLSVAAFIDSNGQTGSEQLAFTMIPINRAKEMLLLNVPIKTTDGYLRMN